MKRRPDSSLTLSISVSVFMLVLLMFVVDTVHAKRGCSAFGHSCFGGHGKRFDPRLRDNLLRESDETTSDRNQVYDNVRLNDQFPISQQKFGGQTKIPLPQARRQGPSRFDPYTLPFIVGQWLSSHRRLHQPDIEFNNK